MSKFEFEWTLISRTSWLWSIAAGVGVPRMNAAQLDARPFIMARLESLRVGSTIYICTYTAEQINAAVYC